MGVTTAGFGEVTEGEDVCLGKAEIAELPAAAAADAVAFMWGCAGEDRPPPLDPPRLLSLVDG